MTRSRTSVASSKSAAAAGQKIFLLAAVVVSVVLLAYLFYRSRVPESYDGETVSDLTLEEIPFDGRRAMGYVEQLCAIGPRRSGSPGMKAQQELLTEHFERLGGQVELQRFEGTNPEDGTTVPMANLIVRYWPQRRERILLAAHYDTLPFPLEDPVDPRGRFVGANDGASGVAVLMELAAEIEKVDGRYGIDLVMFDGEEFIFDENDPFFQGSGYFARRYRDGNPPYSYRWGVLLDMIGDADLQIYQERYSIAWDDTRPLVEAIWATAARLGVREFIPRRGHLVRDDHLPLHEAGIPCCDLIDFDYPAWHTTGDVPEACSALSLAKVGWVVREWLREVQQP